MNTMEYKIEFHDWRREAPCLMYRQHLQAEICTLASLYLRPLPLYQVFDTSTTASLQNKILVTVRKDGVLIGFVSALWIFMGSIKETILHTGITIIRHEYRRSSVKKILFAELFMNVLSDFPQGIWLTSLAEVITSLVHIDRYVEDVFPSSRMKSTGETPQPSMRQRLIAKEISERHRQLMHISPDAVFDDTNFVFRGSNDWDEGRVFVKNAGDLTNRHHDELATKHFMALFRPNAGDEVLQVGYLTFKKITTVAKEEGFESLATLKSSKL